MNDAYATLPLKTIPPAQERDMVRKWRRTRDDALLAEVVMNNMRQAVLYARRICREQFQDDELISLCYGTMLRQAKRYDPNSPLDFFTFAKIGVRGDVNRHFKQLDTVRQSKRVTMPNWSEGVHKMTDSLEVNDTFGNAETRDEARFVLRSIRRCCTEREQVIFALTYFGCLGFHETARLLGVSRSAIQAAHARALEKVRSDCRATERLLFDESPRS